MQLFFVLVVLIVVLSVVFALQNAAAVTVTFLFWQFDSSLALLLLGCFVLGAVASMLAAVPSMLRRRKQAAAQERTIKELRDNLVQYKDLLNPKEQVH